MVNFAKDIVPEIPLEDQETAKTRLYENFKNIQDLHAKSFTGTVSIGGVTLTITQGLIQTVV